MSGLESALASLLARLSERGVRFALVGGLAVSAMTEPRFTRDADVCVAVHDDHEAEALMAWLRASGYRILAVVEQEATGRIATVRLAPEGGDVEGVVLDLLFASSGIEREVVNTADEMDVFERVEVPVASVAALIALKVLARDDADRPQDRVDLVGLLRVAADADITAAIDLLRLIDVRGYGRGKDLLAELSELRAELGV